MSRALMLTKGITIAVAALAQTAASVAVTSPAIEVGEMTLLETLARHVVAEGELVAIDERRPPRAWP